MKKRILLHGIILAAVLLLSACTRDNASAEVTTVPKESQAASEQMLKLTVQKDAENAQQFSTEELGGNFNRGLLYRRVKDVAIEIDGEQMPLETALAQGKTTEEALRYYAQQDARNGFCQESWGSRLGLSWATFDYGDYSVVIAKDIYETPDGQQHLISSMKVHDPQNGLYTEPIYGGYYDEETYQRIDREDWGITFEILEITPEGVAVRATQSGGQQIGTLNITWLNLFRDTGDAASAAGADGFEQIPLNMDGVTEFTIDWSDTCGALDAGTYCLSFEITDVYEPEDVHPLMRNYYDTQVYEVEASIP